MTGIVEEIEALLHVKINNVDELAKATAEAVTQVRQKPQEHFIAGQQTLAIAGLPTQLLQLDPKRISANLAFAVAEPASVTSSGATGAAPANGATVASISAALLQAVAPAGSLFNVQWTAELEGAVAAGDANNMFLSSPLSTLRQQGEFPAVVGQYPQEGLPDFSPGSSGINVQVGQVGAGTAAAIYAAQITATPNGVGQVLICHSEASAIKAIAGVISEGFLFPVSSVSAPIIPIRSSAPVWAVPVGGATIIASVMLEREG